MLYLYSQKEKWIFSWVKEDFVEILLEWVSGNQFYVIMFYVFREVEDHLVGLYYGKRHVYDAMNNLVELDVHFVMNCEVYLACYS